MPKLSEEGLRLEWALAQLKVKGSLIDIGNGVWKLIDNHTEWWFAADVDVANDCGVIVDTHVPDLDGVVEARRAVEEIRNSIRSEGL